MKKESGQNSDRLLSTVLKEILLNDEEYTFVKDTELVYKAASDSFAHMAGLPSAEALVGKTDYDLFDRALADKYRADDKAVLTGAGDILGITERLPDKDGRARWVKTWKRALHGEDGSLVGLYGLGRDMTRMVELEKEAQDAKIYIDLIDHIPGGVGVFHIREGRFCLDYANEGYFQVHHGTRESLRDYGGENVINCVLEEDAKALTENFFACEKSGCSQGGATYRIKGADGAPHWIDARISRAYERDGVQYYYASFTNMDELKRAETKLRESQQSLRDAVAYSDIQFFTWFPAQHRGEIYETSRRLSKLSLHWDRFPEDFLTFAQASPEDAQAYRAMLRRLEDGADESECTVRFVYEGVCSWERLHMTAVRDDSGKLVKAQGYSINITSQKEAEERIREERIRQKALEGSVVEAFSFNITRNTQANLQSASPILYESPVRDEVVSQAEILAPSLPGDPKPREVLLQVANQIPDAKERELFLGTCSGNVLRKAYAAGKYESNISYRRWIGEELRWVSTRAEILPDPESGDVIAFFYTRDINNETVYRRVAERIVNTNYETFSYYDIHSEKLYLKDSGGFSGASFTASPYAQAVERALRDYVLPEEVEETRRKYDIAAILAALAKEPVYSIYYTGRQRDESLPGHPRKRMKSDVFYLDENRDTLVFLQTNITGIFEQERDTREKMAAALAAAEQASVAKTEFLSRMSHEIRTPMNAIIGLDAIALQEKDLSAAMEDHLQKIGISARFLLSLINDILDMSRIESGRMMLKTEPFNFEELIGGINTILYEQCRDSGLDYDCVLKSYTEENYVGDATKLQQVLVNLLGNAVKFTPKGGKVHFMIEQLSRTKDKARLRFEISDTGIGIDEKFIPHLFEAFSQENRGRTSSYGGTGLGLAISKNIVSLMGGDISVHSIKNVGTEFTVEVELSLTGEAIRRHKLIAGGMQPLFTLIVDDDVIVCRHTQMILVEAGLRAEWIDSGAGALEKVVDQHGKREDYDLILLDWKMPDMDGIETAREIRKIVGPEVTIIIMTAYDWTDIEKKAKAAGVDMFMKKPVFASSVTKAFENVFLGKKNEAETFGERVFDFGGRRILLAEDNEINAEIARSILQMKGCAVDIVENGAAAIEAFTTTPVGYYDAILMDVRMPIMDGLEAAKAIRAMKKADSQHIPIIAMTANAFQEDVNMSLDSGMNAHLAKPIDPAMLYETLERFLAERKAKGE
ncbi:MAG: response regulator [Oscillospiraceae bacterium]|nr:response regulator [Oscillospiraceae bacterium]